ncbi:MAG: CTP synthase, partial [Geminicoccaceae bacterium]|nr:CTP synthase [Geminicoccaceae bacterium]
EGLPFLEAIRQLANEMPHGHVAFMHMTLVPWIPSAGELKTKPTQHSVREIRGIGIQPDILICRCDRAIPADARRKIALQCSVHPDRVIAALDCASIYEVPIHYHEESLDRQLLEVLDLDDDRPPDLDAWREIVQRVERPEGRVKIAVVGKYTGLMDAYKSLNEALAHGGIANNVEVVLDWIDAEHFVHADASDRLQGVHAVLVPGGFGERGSEGKIAAVTYARERGLPFFGICFGMQLACIEAARHMAGIDGASSTEFGPCADPVVGLMTEWTTGDERVTRDERSAKGGTMRLGAYPCELAPDSLVHRIYGQDAISERHRHRFEVNINYKDQLELAGLRFSGMSPDGRLPEIVELPGHPWFVGVQFHPELKSRPFAPHPLFADFIRAAREQSMLV